MARVGGADGDAEEVEDEGGETADSHMPRGQQVLCYRRVCVRVSVKQSAGIFCHIQWE